MPTPWPTASLFSTAGRARGHSKEARSRGTRSCMSWRAARICSVWRWKSTGSGNGERLTGRIKGKRMERAKRVRIGVVGAGLIGQVEHIPNLRRLEKLYEIVGIADASADMRRELESRGYTAYGSYQQLLDAGIDAILVAAPDQYHAEITLNALARGKHGFCEKTLCFSVAQAEEIAAARDNAGKEVQVGYMKRYDPSYEKLLSLLPKDAGELRMISVEVQDPDSWPFNQHQGDFVKTGDIPADVVADGKKRRDEQVARGVGRALTGAEMWGYTNSYCSSLIHDINVVHGILEALGIGTGEVIGAAFFAGGDGGHGSVRLQGCDAI